MQLFPSSESLVSDIPGCHLPNSLNNAIIPDQGEFGKRHPGWGRENGKPFYSVGR